MNEIVAPIAGTAADVVTVATVEFAVPVTDHGSAGTGHLVV